MADIRIKDLATTASVTASDDFMAVDGTTNGTRKLSAATPSFATSVTTPSLTSPASTNLTLGTGTFGTALTVASATGAATFAGAVTVATDVTLTNGNLIVASGKGIDFSATAGTGTSELLNDYEEGTWTPTDNSGAALSFTVYSSTYTKIGRLVEVEAAIYFPATASTAAVQITGLPFTAAGGDDNTGGLSITATNVGGNYYILITRGSSTFTINTNADASVTNVTYSGKVLKFFGWYHV